MKNQSSNIIVSLTDRNPDRIIMSLASRVRERRLEKNFTQKEISLRSGIPISTYRKFEQTGKISLRSLVMIAFALNATDDFSSLFDKTSYSNIDEIINFDKTKKRKRGSGIWKI